jgi:hypothetical protein
MKFTVQNKALTRINRGWLQFNAINGVFDTEVFADPRLFFTSDKFAAPLGAIPIKEAQDELVELAKAMWATIIDEKKKTETK